MIKMLELSILLAWLEKIGLVLWTLNKWGGFELKKFFIVILILTGIILFQSEIRQFAVNLTDYIEVEILKKDDMEADGNFFNNIFNNIGINNQNNGNNKNTKEESSSNSTTTQ